MTIQKTKLSIGNILTILLTLFSAGTAWGISNVKIQENRISIEKVEKDLNAFESRVERQYVEMREENSKDRIMLAQIANDIVWLKENKDN